MVVNEIKGRSGGVSKSGPYPRKRILYVQGGLMYSQQNVTPEDVADWKQMSKYFEEMTPLWSPGTKAGYHALTIGYFCEISQSMKIEPSRDRLFSGGTYRKGSHKEMMCTLTET